MDLNKFTKQLAEITKEVQYFNTEINPLGRKLQLEINERMVEIGSLLAPDSDFLYEVATYEKPLPELVAMINEQKLLHTILGAYNFATIVNKGAIPISAKRDALALKRREYFIANIDDDNANDFIMTLPFKDRPEFEQMLLKHKAEVKREAELKSLVEPFMKDLNEMLGKPHLTRSERGGMIKRAQMISPECFAAASKLHKLPLLA